MDLFSVYDGCITQENYVAFLISEEPRQQQQREQLLELSLQQPLLQR